CAAYVREPDLPHEPLVGQAGERSHGRAPRCPGVGGMNQVDVDRKTIEGLETCFAVSRDGFRPTIRHPSAIWPRHAALGDDAGASVPTAGAQRSRHQTLVVPARTL